jgi:hypothetical protein
MWRYIAAERLTCCESPGMDQEAGDEFVLGEKYEGIMWSRSEIV